MKNASVLAVLLAVVCVMHQIGAQETPIEIEIEVEEVPAGYEKQPFVPAKAPVGRYPQGWGLSNSAVLTGGSASASKNVLAGGSTSADYGNFTNTKTHSRSRGNSTIGFGMIGGDGGDNNNVQKGGIEYNGGGIVNFLSKVQGHNNQGVNGASEFWKHFRVGSKPATGGSYKAPEE